MSIIKGKGSNKEKWALASSIYARVKKIYEEEAKGIPLTLKNYVKVSEAYTKILSLLEDTFESEVKKHLGSEFYTWFSVGYYAQMDALMELGGQL